jgi:metal-dependent amidase/aminoacylase/carboxypeptidase family protein
VTSTAEAFGAQVEIDYKRGYPVTVNTPENAEFAAQAAEEVAGSVARDIAPIMPAEDFSYMLEARPGAYIFLGNGDSAMCHHPAYDFNDEAIPAGCSFFVTLVERRLPLGKN